jgi:hypothetical protein
MQTTHDEVSGTGDREDAQRAMPNSGEVDPRKATPARPDMWRHRDVVMVFVGQDISQLGDGVIATALPLLVLQFTGSGVAASSHDAF